MDIQPPQIRSRITVVCAECKRLKLKCDRRTPCGSCMKRGTVMRCIYSPAAAEKVDLHSLNNRLIQVEGLLTLLTAGKTPPPFQSSYPLAQVSLSGASVPQPLVHSRTTAPTKPQITPGTASSSISVSMTDLNDIWLTHCQLDTHFGSRKSTHNVNSVLDGNSNCIKVEPSLMDSLQPMVTDHSPSGTARGLPHTSIYHTPRLNFSCQPDGPSPANPPLLPLPTPSSSSPASSTSSIPPSMSPAPSNSGHHHQHSGTPSSKPYPTTALLALLPTPPVRTHLLRRVRAAHPELVVLVPWDRILDLSADQEEMREREKERAKGREKEKKTLLARTIFFRARSEHSPSPSQAWTSGDEPPPPPPTLPLFVVLCYLLALGGRAEGEGSVDRNFLCALAGQAMDVWEAYRPHPRSHDYDHEHEHEHEHEYDWNLEEEGTSTIDPERDAEDMDHVLACLMQILYLVRDGAGAGVRGKSASGMNGLFPLIGKLVNLARGVGLARDPDDVDDGDGDVNEGAMKREKEKEWRRTLWWEIMFYDTFISDVLNQPATVTLSSYSTRWPACAHQPRPTPLSRKTQQLPPPLQLQLDVDLGDEQCRADDERLQHRPQGGKTTTTTKRDQASTSLKARTKGKSKASGVRPQEDKFAKVVFGVRCRLTHLTQTIKHQLALYPGCSCECWSVSADGAPPHGYGHGGYTLDQAVRLEAEIRSWAADLPPSLRLDPDPNSPSVNFGVLDTSIPSPTSTLPATTPPSAPTGPKSPSAAIVAAELAILANRLIMAVYVPFLRPPRDAAASGVGTTTTAVGQLHPAYVAHSWSPASRATVDAARGVVRAGMVMHRLFVGVSAAGSGNSCVNGMALGEFYSLEKALLDAVVVCMHAGVVSGGVKVQKGKGVMEDASAGLEVLGAMGVGRGKGEMAKVLGALRRKMEGMGVSLGCDEPGVGEKVLKRKHDQVEVGVACLDPDPDGMGREGEVSPPADGMLLDYEGSLFGSQSVDDTVLSRSPSGQHQHHCRSPAGTDTAVQQILSVGREEERDKGKEKERKHVKTGHAGYPVFGYRVRDGGKVAPPWANRRNSRSGSLPLSGAPALPSRTLSTVDYQDNLSGMQQQPVPPQMVQERRESPISQDLPMHPMDFSMTFPVQQPPLPPPPSRPCSTTELFTVPLNHGYPQSQPPRAGSYEPHRGFESSESYHSTGVHYSGGSGSTYVQSQTGDASPQTYFHVLPGYNQPPLDTREESYWIYY